MVPGFVVIASVLVVGCGGSSHSSSTARGPVAQRVCAGVQKAAAPTLSATAKLRIADKDPTNIECVISSRKGRLDVIAQATAVAWTEYDTTTVHQAQAYGPGSVHVAGQLPQFVNVIGGQGAWIPAQNELVATNGTESSGGSYLTVTLTKSKLPSRRKIALAQAVAKVSLALAPRGPSPGPAPS